MNIEIAINTNQYGDEGEAFASFVERAGYDVYRTHGSSSDDLDGLWDAFCRDDGTLREHERPGFCPLCQRS